MNSETKLQSALITGATGFTGFRLAELLASQKSEVHVIVRPNSKVDALRTIQGNLHIHVSDGSTAGMVEILKTAAPKCVYHLASLFIAEHAQDDVTPLIESNILFGAQLLEAMRLTDTPGLVCAGTSWQHFENGASRPSVLYAATKEAFEVLARYYADAHGLRIISLKLFDSYGPRDPRRKFFWHLRKAAQTGERIQMSGGEQKMELVYIEDIARAFSISGDRIATLPASAVEFFRLPSKKALTLREIAAVYEQVIGKSLNLEWGGRPYRPREIFTPWTGDPVLPGWEPQISLTEGIRLMEGIAQ